MDIFTCPRTRLFFYETRKLGFRVIFNRIKQREGTFTKLVQSIDPLLAINDFKVLAPMPSHLANDMVEINERKLIPTQNRVYEFFLLVVVPNGATLIFWIW